MPTYVKGNLWDEIDHATLILFTGNSTLNTHGQLIMGKGSAGEAKRLFPALPTVFGEMLQEEGAVGGLYGIFTYKIAYKDKDPQTIGVFQTKRHWSQDSDPLVIAHSTGYLCAYLDFWNMRFESVAMPFPGIGYGNLQRDQILPLLEPLPERVRIYEPKY